MSTSAENTIAPKDGPRSPVIEIRPPTGWRAPSIRELWAYREMVYFTIYRDVKTRYTQTMLGPLWAVLQPLITMVIYSVIFGMFARMPSDGIPYPLFVYAALVPWTFLSTGLNTAIGSLHGNFTIITKIYFPRIVLPVQAVLGGIVDLALSLVILLGIAVYYHQPLTPRLLLLPLFLIPGVLAVAGLGLFLSAMSVQFRDVRYIAPHLTVMWMYASPILYPRSVMPAAVREWAALNPVCTVVEGCRWAFHAGEIAPWPWLAGSIGVSVGLFVLGGAVFRRLESNLVDVL